MASGYLGSPVGNTIVPVVNLVKQSKLVTNSVLGIASTVGGNALTEATAYATAYADSAGLWRLRFNIHVTFTNTLTAPTLSITGVVFKSGTYQTITCMAVGTSPYTGAAQVMDGANTIYGYGVATSTIWMFSGDVELNAEPAWYAANAENSQQIAAYSPSASATSAGLVDLTTQTFAGNKTFSNNLAVTGTLNVAGAITIDPTETSANLRSGKYTPTFVLKTNLDATPTGQDGHYLRVGNMVTVYFTLDGNPTTAGSLCECYMTIPIASNFTGGYDLIGNGTTDTGKHCRALADTVGDRALIQWVAGGTGAESLYMSLGYTVV